jgi:hypothetical protein
MKMNDRKRTYNGMQKPIDNSSYEIIELNESEPIIFQRDKKKQQQQLCEIVNTKNNKHLILVIPKQENIATNLE